MANFIFKNTCFCNILRNYEKVGGDRGEKGIITLAILHLVPETTVTRAMGCLNINKSAHRFISITKVSCDAATSVFTKMHEGLQVSDKDI